MIRLNASLYYIAKLSKTMKWLKIKMPLSCQNCPVIDGRLTVECPMIIRIIRVKFSYDDQPLNPRNSSLNLWQVCVKGYQLVLSHVYIATYLHKFMLICQSELGPCVCPRLEIVQTVFKKIKINIHVPHI